MERLLSMCVCVRDKLSLWRTDDLWPSLSMPRPHASLSLLYRIDAWMWLLSSRHNKGAKCGACGARRAPRCASWDIIGPPASCCCCRCCLCCRFLSFLTERKTEGETKWGVWWGQTEGEADGWADWCLVCAESQKVRQWEADGETVSERQIDAQIIKSMDKLITTYPV